MPSHGLLTVMRPPMRYTNSLYIFSGQSRRLYDPLLPLSVMMTKWWRKLHFFAPVSIYWFPDSP